MITTSVGTFPKINLHPDIVGSNVSLHMNKMIVYVALYFGGNFSPANWVPITRVHYFLAQWMFEHTIYQEDLNNEALNLITL